MTELELLQWLEKSKKEYIKERQLELQEMTLQELYKELNKKIYNHPDYIKHNGNKQERDLITQELRHRKLKQLLS